MKNSNGYIYAYFEKNALKRQEIFNTTVITGLADSPQTNEDIGGHES